MKVLIRERKLEAKFILPAVFVQPLDRKPLGREDGTLIRQSIWMSTVSHGNNRPP